MKLVSSLILLSTLSFAASSVQAAQPGAGPTGCAGKRNDIENQLEQARKHNNWGQISGLEKALQENKEHCDDGTLLQDRKQKVLDARHEVAQRERDLKKAEKKGDAEKIDKRKAKLAESKAELKQALEELEK